MKVAILMGSPRDEDKMAGASEMLERFDVPHEVHVMSAHRTPEQVAELASNARDNGYGVIICGAGMAAHLAGAVSAHTTLPVIGVPLSGGVSGGMDALLSTVQMPRGIPVATVAVDGSANAAVLAVEMLSLNNPDLTERLKTFRDEGAR
ncbi:MAG: 5-(carboxyamino)imidazole ribonucleotide mutase [Acidimicrobiales bacterium]|jgi:5-(carboxyamino)imidazole ribonucleotide mutase|nr:5-(carboxyamino)imidazole ribonucleotide mutase [Acidimicrobiales bacterium]MDP6900769.1 5-(carboxyamino)imidazole ribonucleotide mutase [Acidimicrobiales bacterium]